MKKNKKVVVAILAVFMMLTVFSACGGKGKPADDGVNIKEQLSSMIASDKELDLAGKYKTVAEITDGKIDEALIGKWVTLDGDTSYTFSDNGIMTAESKKYDSVTEVKYTCLDVEDRNVLCEDLIMNSYPEDGGEPEETVVINYNVYSVQDDALYMVTVETTDDEVYGSYSATFVNLYKADDKGNIIESYKKNAISLSSFYGKWDSEGTEVIIDNKGLTVNGNTYALSLSDSGNLIVGKDGKSTEYKYAMVHNKVYGMENRTEPETQEIILSFFYTGKDENDVPNLVDIMDNWKKDYDWNEWYYTGKLTTPSK